MLRSRNKKPESPESGFTLIEVLLAMAILAIGLLSIGVAQLSAMKISSRSRNLSQATYVAEQNLDSILARPSSDSFFTTAQSNVTDPNSPFDIDPTDNDNTTFTVSTSVDVDQPSAGLSLVTINVVWDTPSRTVHSINLQGVKRRASP